MASSTHTPRTPSDKSRKVKTLTVAVLSDVHAYTARDPDGDTPSFMDMSLGEDNKAQHPLAGLEDLIERKTIKADLLFCAGDLGDKADPVAIQYVWDKLQKLGKLLGVKSIFATPGNHDHDSRLKESNFDPRGMLQSLSPQFPFKSDKINDKFWSRNYSIVSKNGYRIVTLNSSAFHGIKKEHMHGRISEYTLRKLTEELRCTPAPPINILLTHHHPHKHEEISAKMADYQMMEGGGSLLSNLSGGDLGSWMFIHGHIHVPILSYAQGASGGAPIVFSCGSLCASLGPAFDRSVQNQFYRFEFDFDEIEKYGLVGRYSAWNWAIGHGWRPGSFESQLPGEGGFGYRLNKTPFGKQVAKECPGNPGDWIKWEELILRIPEISYLTPQDLDILWSEIRENHNLEPMRDSSDGPILQIGRLE